MKQSETKRTLYLYKYRSDDIYTIKLLCEQSLHFSHPLDFNDPFDCRPPCSAFFTEDMILSYVSDTFPMLIDTVKEKLPYIQQSINNDMPIFTQDVENIFNSLYLCCFSYNANSPLMWAHYCNNHTGLCLGFDTHIGGTFYQNGVKKIVEYVKNRQLLDISNGTINKEQILKIITEKYEPWQYEEEVRIIKTEEQMFSNGESQNKFEKSALTAIFFGLRMPKERQDFYMLLCKKLGYDNVSFYKMKLPYDGSYFLIPQQIE